MYMEFFSEMGQGIYWTYFGGGFWLEDILCLSGISCQRVMLTPGNKAECLRFLLVDKGFLFLSTLSQ